MKKTTQNILRQALSDKFKVFVVLFLLVIVAFQVYAQVGRAPGKISEPIPQSSYPTTDKGYIGHPSDALLNQSEQIADDDSLFSMMGKTWYQANNDSGSSGESGVACGYCTQTDVYYCFDYTCSSGTGAIGTRVINVTGCCEEAGLSYDNYDNSFTSNVRGGVDDGKLSYCAPEDGYEMFPNSASSYDSFVCVEP